VLWLIFLLIQLLLVGLTFGGKAILWVALLYGPILLISLLINASFALWVGGSFTDVIFWPLGYCFTFEHEAGACSG
jgi:hypothetical protein